MPPGDPNPHRRPHRRWHITPVMPRTWPSVGHHTWTRPHAHSTPHTNHIPQPCAKPPSAQTRSQPPSGTSQPLVDCPAPSDIPRRVLHAFDRPPTPRFHLPQPQPRPYAHVPPQPLWACPTLSACARLLRTCPRPSFMCPQANPTLPDASCASPTTLRATHTHWNSPPRPFWIYPVLCRLPCTGPALSGCVPPILDIPRPHLA